MGSGYSEGLPGYVDSYQGVLDDLQQRAEEEPFASLWNSFEFVTCSTS